LYIKITYKFTVCTGKGKELNLHTENNGPTFLAINVCKLQYAHTFSESEEIIPQVLIPH